MTGEQVVRVVRAVARHLAALADDLEQITSDGKPEQTDEFDGYSMDPQDVCKVGDPDPTPDAGIKCATLDNATGLRCRRWPHPGGTQHVGIRSGRVATVWTS